MTKTKKLIISLSLALGLVGTVVYATTLPGSQGGTGFSTTTASNVGNFLQVVSTTPFLKFTFGTTSASGGTSSTTINGLQPANNTFQFNTSSSILLATTSPNIISLSVVTSSLGLAFINAYTTTTLSAGTGILVSNGGIGATTVTNIGVQSLQNATGTFTITSNLTMTNNVLDTVQDIRSTSSPTFASTTLTGQLNVGTFADFPGISNPAEPAAGFARLHGDTTQGITRLEVADQCGFHNIINRDNYFVAKNVSGSVMATGTIVYQVGNTGAVPNVDRAQANTTTTMPAIGFAENQVSNNGFGCFMNYGVFTPFDTSAFTSADRIYLSPTASGTYQRARPTTPNLVQRIGSILNSGVTNGSVLVTIAPAELGRETGTISPTFNINGALALTSSTLNSFIAAGTGITKSQSSTGTITISSSGGATATSSFAYTIKNVSTTPNASTSEDVYTFDQPSTIKSVWAKNLNNNQSISWNLQYVSTGPTSSILGYFPFDNNTPNDFSGNNLSVTSSITYAPGKIGNAASFNGTTNGVYIAPSQLSDNVTGTNFTMGGWFTRTDNTHYVILFDRRGAGGNQYFCGIHSSADGADGNKPMFVHNGTTITGTNAITDAVFHHEVCVYDGTNFVFYIDGVADSTTTVSFSMTAVSDAQTRIGHDGASSAVEHHVGLIDDAFIANRTFTPSEIINLYNSGIGKAVCTINCTFTYHNVLSTDSVAFSNTTSTKFTSFASSTPAAGNDLQLTYYNATTSQFMFTVYYQ